MDGWGVGFTLLEGTIDGCIDDVTDGAKETVGILDGKSLGIPDGILLGFSLGAFVCDVVGRRDGL